MSIFEMRCRQIRREPPKIEKRAPHAIKRRGWAEYENADAAKAWRASETWESRVRREDAERVVRDIGDGVRELIAERRRDIRHAGNAVELHRQLVEAERAFAERMASAMNHASVENALREFRDRTAEISAVVRSAAEPIRVRQMNE
jgi:hypothetical protein